MVNHSTARLVQHFESSLAGSKCQISVFVISRRIAPVKPSDAVENFALRVQTGCRAVIDFAQLVKRWVRLIGIPTVCPGTPIPKNLAARFLQTAIFVNELRPH